MKNRSETDFGELSRAAEMPVMLGARRAEDPTDTIPYVEGPRPENAEQGGHLRGRSRFFMNSPS